MSLADPPSFVSFADLSIPPPSSTGLNGPSSSSDPNATQPGDGAGSALLTGLKRFFGGGGAGAGKDGLDQGRGGGNGGPPTTDYEGQQQHHPPSSKYGDTSTSSHRPRGASSSRAKDALAANLGLTRSGAPPPPAARGRSVSRGSRSTTPARASLMREDDRASSPARAQTRTRTRSSPSSPPPPPPPPPASSTPAVPPSPARPSSSAGANGARFVRPTRLSNAAAPSLARVSLQTTAVGADPPLSSSVEPGGWAGRVGEDSPTLSEGFDPSSHSHSYHGQHHPFLPSSSSASPFPFPSSSSAADPPPSATAQAPRRPRRYSLVGVGSGALGLALRRTPTIEPPDGGGDARSVMSMSTSAPQGAGRAGSVYGHKPSPSAVESMRRMHGNTVSTKYWMKDESARECTSCQTRFVLWNRRHHCRLCGHIFCGNCTPFTVEQIGRVCVNCHASVMKLLKRESSRSFIEDDRASLSYSYRAPFPSSSAHPPPSASLPSYSPVTPGSALPPGTGGAGFSRPGSLYRNHSHLRRPVSPPSPTTEDRISERSSRPASPVFDEEDEARQAAEEGGKKSPKTSLMHQQQQLAVDQASRLDGSGGAGGAAESSANDAASVFSTGLVDGGGLQSPTLSAVPFRKDLGEEDDDHATQNGDADEQNHEEERHGGEENGFGGAGEAKGLGLDLGEGVELDGPRPPSTRSRTRAKPPPPPKLTFPSIEEPAERSPQPGSVLFPRLPDDHAPRHSPSIPNFARSTSRLSLFGGGSLMPFPFDLSETNPDAFYAEAFEAADEPVIPISPTALAHIRHMIRQSLEREGVPHAKAWAVELERLLHDVADRLAAMPYRVVGEDVDVRQYVRVKRIPGGRPKDSEFVSGVVITKNLMHKGMPRQMTNPKVMLLSQLPLDFQRDNQFYTLDTVRAQADQAVDKLVDRICQFFPDLLLVEETVSQHALKLLRKKDVAAARHVKHSALEAVARALGADIITSISDLADRALPSDKHRPLRIVSRCQSFRVQTFVHPLIPGGRKTILRFEGEDHHKPCTIILRGESFENLAKLKRIVHMLILVVYNAKLEGYLLYDEKIEVLPPSPNSPLRSTVKPAAAPPPPPSPSPPLTSKQISAALKPYEAAALSGSALVHYPPPYPLARMADEDRKIRELRDRREAEETQQIIDDEKAASRARSLSVSGGASAISLPDLASSAASSVVGSPPEKSFFPSTTLLSDAAALAADAPREANQQTDNLVAQSAFAEAEERHKQHLVAWDAYRKANSDSFDPVDYQQLYVLESLLLFDPRTDEPSRLCRPPTVRSLEFYGESDRTIGAFLRELDSAQRTSEPCPSPSCHEILARHQRVYVHDGYVVRLSTEPCNNEGFLGAFAMSAECRKPGCRCYNRLVPVTVETSRLSFAKFLELCFYPSQRLACADPKCSHEGQLDHVRYWHYGSIRVEIKIDRIDLRDVVAPPRQVKVRPDEQLKLREAEYEQVKHRAEAFFKSVQTRIDAFKFDCVPVDRIEECKSALADFSARCQREKDAVLRLLSSVYEHAHTGNGTEMTVVRRALQEKSHAFEADWTAFAKKVMPAEAADLRRVSTTQLKRLFPEASAGLIGSPGMRSVSSSLTPALEVEEHEHLQDGEDGGLHSPSSETSSLRPEDSASANGDASSVLSAEIVIDPPQLQQGELSAPPALIEPPSATDIVPPLPSPSLFALPDADDLASSARPPRSPRHPRSPGLYRPIEDSEPDSDSTVCLEDNKGNTSGRARSPFINRQFPPSAADETSAFESEQDQPSLTLSQRRRYGPVVASRLETFESPAPSRSGSWKKHGGSPIKPGLRRAQTDKPRSLKSSNRSSSRPSLVVSDGDSSYALNVGVLHLQTQQLVDAANRPSRLPTLKVPKANSLPFGAIPFDSSADGIFDSNVSGLGLSLSPTTSRAPSRASSRPPSRGHTQPSSPTSTRSRLPLPVEATSPTDSFYVRPPLQSNWSSRSTIKGKAKSRSGAQSESSDTGRPLQRTVSKTSGYARATTSSTARKVPGRRVVSGGPSGTGTVRTMAARYDSQARKAQEREKQRKTAKPVVKSQPTSTVFVTIKEAMGDDSDDDVAGSVRGGGNASDASADDERDDEADVPDRDDEDAVPEVEAERDALGNAPPRPSAEPTPRPVEPVPAAVSMADALARSVSMNSLDPSAMVPPVHPHPPPPPAPESLSRSVEPSDSEFPSVPPSPLLPDSFTFPRMSEGESSGAERRSIFNAFSSLWNYRNGDFSPLAYPTLPTEHVYADNPVVLRDDEPTSIIAHVLSSRKYYQAFETSSLPRIREGLMANKAESTKSGMSSAPLPEPDLARTIEDILRAPTQRSFKLGDVELGDISARCTVFWVEQFEALRRQCGCDSQFIESLSRCFKWDAVGGKSKVDFMKTLDDRFIVKQLSRPEMEVFARFAPAYFQYMADALFQGKPTVLAKVFGIYRISLGKHYRNVDFLVMENLFYGRQLKQIFDLKGSTRNRRADESNPVLLDENLLELSLKNPFYVREESKEFIKLAIYNDSHFLSELNVMDYSLVVGVDAVNPELCVGIVDYIRTYTWDKRIESWVKETTFLGGASKAGGPTVITPKQYKMRFREAIDGYLLLSPTPWLNTRSLLPPSAGDALSKPYLLPSGPPGGGSFLDTASTLNGGYGGGGGGASTYGGGSTVPPTPRSVPASAFAAPAML